MTATWLAGDNDLQHTGKALTPALHPAPRGWVLSRWRVFVFVFLLPPPPPHSMPRIEKRFSGWNLNNGLHCSYPDAAAQPATGAADPVEPEERAQKAARV